MNTDLRALIFNWSNCPFCDKPLEAIVRRYHKNVTCYNFDDDGTGYANYTDMDCSNPECPHGGTPIYSMSGGLGFGLCYICQHLVGGGFGGKPGAIKAWGQIHYFHWECQPKRL